MNKIVLLKEEDSHSKKEKILFPEKEDLSRLQINMNEPYDTLLILEYKYEIDDNITYIKLAYLQNNQLFVFYERDEPNSLNLSRDICDDNNFYNNSNSDITNFFIEARHVQYDLKFHPTKEQKRLKI